MRFDPVFLAEWGGMWLEPYVVFRGSSDSNLFDGDPYVMLAEVLNKSGPMPVPDVQTGPGSHPESIPVSDHRFGH